MLHVRKTRFDEQRGCRANGLLSPSGELARWTMLVWRGDRLLMALSTLGLVRCYVSPRLGRTYVQRSAQLRLYRRARSTGNRSTNEVVGPKTKPSDAVTVEQDSHADEWDTWEFGTWKVWCLLPLGSCGNYCVCFSCGSCQCHAPVSCALSLSPPLNSCCIYVWVQQGTQANVLFYAVVDGVSVSRACP